ncbi:hypothetical protein KI387_031064 [Taxus chinensis]|uniref:F-box domain-containing protein n=1 Tax=Taxus chinensis TaxID=29808 RepID=A0AA38FF21_TAXCH|nr:hypothetical protein KI387_031064 [Taxus chinensis]
MGKVHDAGSNALMSNVDKLILCHLCCSIIWPEAGLHELLIYGLSLEIWLLVISDISEICKVLKENAIMSDTEMSTGFHIQHKFESTDTTFVFESESSLLPGLPDDVAKHCLALVPRADFQSLGSVCKRWRQFIQTKEFSVSRKLAGSMEEWLYVLTKNEGTGRNYWQVFNSVKAKWQSLPPMPGPAKTGFSFVVIDGKLLVMAGLFENDIGIAIPSADVYKYESALNMWSKLPNMKVARYDFACAAVDGLVYVVGGHGVGGETLSSVEVYDPRKNHWTLIESLRRPRWGCFACGLEGRLYVMGGRSSLMIGYSRCIDVYNPSSHRWDEMKNGCAMVVANAVLDSSLFCIEWKNDRQLAIFSAPDSSWKRIPVPLVGSMSVNFCFGILNRKLLLFSTKNDPYYKTLVYDPQAVPGSEWKTTDIRPLGTCLCSVTITA